jgi:hypothetical protein
MTREAAEQFFAVTGYTIHQRLEGIADTARKLRRLTEAGHLYARKHGAEINRWAARHLDLCVRTFCRLPPVELVKLMERQLGADRPPRTRRRNPEKFSAAAEYEARHPAATSSAIARAIGYNQQRMIAKWRKDPCYQEIVRVERWVLRQGEKNLRGEY